jgi:dipeptidyl aminopeptidase/acylaminoacyl peptidase
LREVAKLGGSIRSTDLPRNVVFSSLSPDGNSVAFIAFPDSIFSYSISEETTELLAVPGAAWGVHSPVWSPDGRRLAYVNGNPRWASHFVFYASSIWFVDADGGEPVRVTGDQYMDVSPAWLDENHLLFLSNREGPRELYVVEVGPTGPRGEPSRVPGVVDAHSISYSRAGRKLAFSKAAERANIWSYPIDATALTADDGIPVTSENTLIVGHDVSPDGEWLAYTSSLRGNSDIYMRSLATGSPMPITDSPLNEFQPVWSPDGTEIAFLRDVGGREHALMLVPAYGGNPVQVIRDHGLWYHEWHPSGLEIFYWTWKEGSGSEAWVVSREAKDASWGRARQFTDFGCIPYDKAPDGSGVLCADLAAFGLVMVSFDGEVQWRYDLRATGLTYWFDARFAPDGSKVFVTGYHESGVGGIWSIPPQGGEPSLVVETGGYDDFSVGPSHIYVTLDEHEVDIWVADVEVER